MPSDELDPKLEAATQEFIGVSKNISDAIAIEARGSGSARYKKSIAISLDWPARLPKHPLSEQIAQHIAAAHKIGTPRSVVPNEAAALSFYQQDFLSAFNVTVGNFVPHGAALLERRTQRSIVRKVLDALLPESDLDPNRRPEIPGIDLKRAAVLLRYGVAHKVDGLKIVFWLQQELAYDVIFQEVTAGGVPADYPADPATPELGGHGARIADVIRHGIDSDFGLDLTRIANWMETGRWPLESSAGEIFAVISEEPVQKHRKAFRPHVELSWLLGLTRGLQEWRTVLADALILQLQLLSDLAIMRPPEFESEAEIVSPSAPAASQLELATTPDPPVDPPVPRISDEPEEAKTEDLRMQQTAGAQEDARKKTADGIATLLKATPWKKFIAGIMLDHPDYSNKEICDAADRSRNSRDEGVTKKELAPPVSWMKASGETRRPDEWLLDEVLWARVYDNKNSRHALEGEFSKIRKKLKLKKRRAA